MAMITRGQYVNNYLRPLSMSHPSAKSPQDYHKGSLANKPKEAAEAYGAQTEEVPQGMWDQLEPLVSGLASVFKDVQRGDGVSMPEKIQYAVPYGLRLDTANKVREQQLQTFGAEAQASNMKADAQYKQQLAANQEEQTRMMRERFETLEKPKGIQDLRKSTTEANVMEATEENLVTQSDTQTKLGKTQAKQAEHVYDISSRFDEQKILAELEHMDSQGDLIAQQILGSKANIQHAADQLALARQTEARLRTEGIASSARSDSMLDLQRAQNARLEREQDLNHSVNIANIELNHAKVEAELQTAIANATDTEQKAQLEMQIALMQQARFRPAGSTVGGGDEATYTERKDTAARAAYTLGVTEGLETEVSWDQYRTENGLSPQTPLRVDQRLDAMIAHTAAKKDLVQFRKLMTVLNGYDTVDGKPLFDLSNTGVLTITPIGPDGKPEDPQIIDTKSQTVEALKTSLKRVTETMAATRANLEKVRASQKEAQ